jgi:CBS domain-containing protein
MKKFTVSDLLASLTQCVELPIIAPESTLKEVVGAMVKGHRRRIVYVVDNNRKFMGAITLTDLKNVIFHYYLNSTVRDAVVVTEHIEELFTSEKARDVMNPDLVVCYEDDSLHDIIMRMEEWNVMDIPVLDREDRVIADLDILCLLELWLTKGDRAF